jgi:gamma-glutamylputrescine oxidase
MINADPGAYGSSWLAATKVASPHRAPLAVELDVDVCVIGAGLAGLTVAREVARRGWSVVVLEAQSVAWNASGRNTGFVLPGYAASGGALATRVGIEHARKLWRLSEQGAEYVRRVARDEQMPGVHLSEGGWLHVAKTDSGRAMQTEAELLAGKFGADVELRSTEQVREDLRTPLYFNGLHYPRGAWPPRPSATAHASTRTAPRWRSIRRACASASRPPTRACGRTMSCSRATSISPT